MPYQRVYKNDAERAHLTRSKPGSLGVARSNTKRMSEPLRTGAGQIRKGQKRNVEQGVALSSGMQGNRHKATKTPPPKRIRKVKGPTNGRNFDM